MCETFGYRSGISSCDKLYSRHALYSEYIGINGVKIKPPMKVEMENKRAKDIINNWSVGGRTRHVGVRFNFLRESKENGIIEIQWISTHENCSDILTKNLPVNLYDKHSKSFCVDDHEADINLWEGVESIKNKSRFKVIKSDTGWCNDDVRRRLGNLRNEICEPTLTNVNSIIKIRICERVRYN
jgi:hypothetical protein